MLEETYIAERIKELCERKGMTMYALSQKTGVTQSSLSSMMNKGRLPNFLTLSRICEGLDLTLAQFFTPEGKRPDLSPEQERLLDVWDSLSKEEREAVKTYVRGIQLK